VVRDYAFEDFIPFNVSICDFLGFMCEGEQQSPFFFLSNFLIFLIQNFYFVFLIHIWTRVDFFNGTDVVFRQILERIYMEVLSSILCKTEVPLVIIGDFVIKFHVGNK
jgi:hypothetical protein